SSSCSFTHLLPAPPIPTLFPYTTLFRSPHAVIRIKAYDPVELAGAPESLKHIAARDTEWAGMQYTIQVAPEDCTGCGICVDVCPDRKSTRLNSSYVKISYAVFCLKKKNN